MRRNIGLLFLLLSFLFFFGCANDEEIQYMHNQIYNLDARLDAIDKRLSALEKEVARLSEKNKAKRLETLAERQAELAAELEKLQAEQLRLNGQLEQLTYLQTQDRNSLHEFQTEVLERLARLEASLGKSSPRPKTSVSKAVSEEGLYQKALNLFRQKKYSDAQRAFEEYLRQYPKGKRAPNATFWIGECLYQRKLYEEAILQYQKVIDNFPKSPKVPAALLKQGLSFLHLGDREAAKIVFKKLVRTYPRTEQARVARKYLAKLGKK